MRQKSKVTADLKRNLLRVVLVGSLSKTGMQEIYTEIRFCVADLKPGFNVMNDLSDCKIGHLAGLGTFKRIRQYLADNKVGTVIRIAQKRQLVFHQVSRIVDRSSTYEIVSVSSQEEAEAILIELEGHEVEQVSSG